MITLQELAEKYNMLGYYIDRVEREAGSREVGKFVWAAEGFFDGLEAAGAIKSYELGPLIREVRKQGGVQA